MHSIKLAAAAAMGALALASSAVSAATTYTISPYAVAGSMSTQLWGLNNHGVLVGGDDNGGFIDDHGTLTTLGSAGTFVAGISDGGLAVGGDGTTSFFYDAGVLTPFAVAGAEATQVRAISANGRYVTGVFTTAGGDSDGFVWDNLTSTLSTLVPPAGAAYTVVQGVNDNGVATGSLNRGLGSVLFDAVQGTTSHFTDWDGLSNVRFRAINDAGDIGGWAFVDGSTIGFIDKQGEGVTTFDLGFSSTSIYALNDVGQAVGFDVDADGNAHSFTVDTSPVPEPSSVASMAFALLAGCVRLKKRRSAGQAA
jgi:uncharacterized membrane protein